MASSHRDRAVRQERGRGVVRALYRSEFESIAEARREAKRLAERQFDKAARLLPDALASGLTTSEIARLMEVSRQTLYELRGRYSDDAGDVTLGVLLAIANSGSAERSEIVALMRGRSPLDVGKIIDQLIASGQVDEEFNEDPDEPAMHLRLTAAGLAGLEAWEFQYNDMPDDHYDETREVQYNDVADDGEGFE